MKPYGIFTKYVNGKVVFIIIFLYIVLQFQVILIKDDKVLTLNIHLDYEIKNEVHTPSLPMLLVIVSDLGDGTKYDSTVFKMSGSEDVMISFILVLLITE